MCSEALSEILLLDLVYYSLRYPTVTPELVKEILEHLEIESVLSLNSDYTSLDGAQKMGLPFWCVYQCASRECGP